MPQLSIVVLARFCGAADSVFDPGDCVYGHGLRCKAERSSKLENRFCEPEAVPRERLLQMSILSTQPSVPQGPSAPAPRSARLPQLVLALAAARDAHPARPTPAPRQAATRHPHRSEPGCPTKAERPHQL